MLSNSSKCIKGLLTEREVLKTLSPIFHGTDRTSEVNKLFIIWLDVFL